MVAKRGTLLGVTLLVMALLVGGCVARQSPAPAPVSTGSVIGLWTNAAAKGQAASLSQIGFAEDGAFRHSGNNALGLPVNFGGSYQVGSSDQGPVMRLTYDDFPQQPTVWYFRLNGETLTVAPLAADLETEAAIVFQREKQQ
ncbi:MAG: hypothetical protein WCJ13_01885 [Coriobacteriia bacterium]